ncbi:phosphatase domain-containing protein [Micromonospora yangpuensis]|uniref:Protein-tyrosine phosphatase n=1 Tax=Micromonospora yangpuensis TaxID=683228 RepID=A0A1C6U2K7_9ACTN|nr:protein-tyrosine phosphatase family protein [Micromonospora yangpuensis]GGM10351.1 hypothetical protein GCM10012279_30480 [Micromonospora yangpuensis]SCL48163.1 Protein-tyrosine phosphatase [Micromonospora yangpuensis]
MTEQWSVDAPGVIELPSGRRFRGRGLRYDSPDGPTPTFAVHLTDKPTAEPQWERVWVRWRDFWLPADPDEALRVLRQAYDRAESDRVEIACGGGIGRTGTGLATLCVFEGMAPDEAVNWVRRHYHRRAVEVRWQRRFLRHAFSAAVGPTDR